jgi:hypothetical protein
MRRPLSLKEIVWHALLQKIWSTLHTDTHSERRVNVQELPSRRTFASMGGRGEASLFDVQKLFWVTSYSVGSPQ